MWRRRWDEDACVQRPGLASSLRVPSRQGPREKSSTADNTGETVRWPLLERPPPTPTCGPSHHGNWCVSWEERCSCRSGGKAAQLRGPWGRPRVRVGVSATLLWW